jgi:Arc-like DNA binding domain
MPLIKTVQINMRLRTSLRDRLQAAARANGVSVNAELVSRLERSFAKDAEFGSQEETNLARLIASAFTLGGQRAAKTMKHPEWTPAEWMVEPSCYEAAMEAVLSALQAAQPVRYTSKHPETAVREQHAKLHNWAARVAAGGGDTTNKKSGEK